MLELLLIDELERIGRKDLATEVYEGNITDELKDELYRIFLSVLTDEEKRNFNLIDANIARIQRKLSRKSLDKNGLNYYLLSKDLDVLLTLKKNKIRGTYHLKDANDKYLACAICSYLKQEPTVEETVSLTV